MSVQPVQVEEMVRVLEEDPELARDLSAGALEAARSALAPLLALEPGVRGPSIEKSELRAHLGLLVLDGLITVHVRFGAVWATEFLGPSDVFRPWALTGQFEVAEAWWETLTPARVAILDWEFASQVRPWPELTAALFDRYTVRLASQLLQSAIRKARRVEDRIWVVLWHFAARWGRVSSEGYVLRLPNVTGEVLANIVGARRQSVSTALSALSSRGVLQRRPDGSWVILEKPPQLAPEMPAPPHLVR